MKPFIAITVATIDGEYEDIDWNKNAINHGYYDNCWYEDDVDDDYS